MKHWHLHRSRSRMRGAGLIELMVGLVLGAIVASAAVAVMAAPLKAARQSAQEHRVEQDVRAASALINRWLRQAIGEGDEPYLIGPYGDSLSLQIRSEDPAVQPAASLTSVSLRLRDGTLEWRWGHGAGATWQALTDRQQVRVLALNFGPLDANAAAACEPWPGLRWSMEFVPTGLMRSGPGRDQAAEAQRVVHEVRVRHPIAPAGCPT